MVATMTTKKSQSPIYRVLFSNQGKIYEVYARSVSQGELFGFIRIEDLLFGERTQVVVDPAEEELKLEFEGVRGFQVPMQAVLRVDEVDKQGANRVRQGGDADNIAAFPSAFMSPTGPKKPDNR